MRSYSSSAAYRHLQSMILNEFPFSRYNETYQTYLPGLFPFSYRVPAKQEGMTIPAGVSVDEDENKLISPLIQEIFHNLELDQYADGIVVRTFERSKINSAIAGVVIETGINEEKNIGSYIKIQTAEAYVVTVGFLQEIAVSKLEHVRIGDVLGIGSMVTDLEGRVYYLAIQNEAGEYLDVLDFLRLKIENGED